MKILFVGASGIIGGGVLEQCLAHPNITTIVAFVRRELPAAISSNSKLKCVIKKDFAEWQDDELRAHADAAAMVWTMGTNTGNLQVDFEYPLTFQENFLRILEENPERPPFRYVLLSGKFVTQDQDKTLWFLDMPRKLKGKLETKTLGLAETHPQWKAYIVRPGGIVSKGMFGRGVVMGAAGAVLGKNWSITVEELGAFMAQAAASDDENCGLVENSCLVERGRELLAERARSSSSP